MNGIEKIVLGTVQLGLEYGISNTLGKPSVENGIQLLEFAQNSGINTLDTAQAYGSAMDLIGLYHRSHASRFEVIGKFHLQSGSIQDIVKTELESLSIPRYEALLFHSFQDFKEARKQVFHTLNELKQGGYLRKIGLSVYSNDQFKQAIDHDQIQVIQLPFNLLDNSSQRGALMEEAKKRGKELHVRSVFLQGLFFLQEDHVPDKLTLLTPHLREIKRIAKKHDLTINQLSLAYALNNRNIDRVLVGVVTEEQLKKNIQGITELKSLPPAVAEEIDHIIVKETDLLNPVNWK